MNDARQSFQILLVLTLQFSRGFLLKLKLDVLVSEKAAVDYRFPLGPWAEGAMWAVAGWSSLPVGFAAARPCSSGDPCGYPYFDEDGKVVGQDRGRASFAINDRPACALADHDVVKLVPRLGPVVKECVILWLLEPS